MRTRLLLPVLIAASSVVATGASAQSLGDQIREATREALRGLRLESSQGGTSKSSGQTEQFSRKIKIGRDARLTVSNTSGDIIVTGGSGDEVSIEATKRTSGRAADLATVQVEVTDRSGRIVVETRYARRTDRVSVDYTITVPASVSVEVRSVSGDAKVSNVQGVVRAETVSGSIMLTSVPRVELAKTVSGDIEMTGLSMDSEVQASTVSGDLRVKGGRARTLTLGSVSGDIAITDVLCDRIEAKTVSATVEFSGTIAKNGRYELHSFSGDVRLMLSGASGFDLNAKSFSGSVHSDWALAGAGDSGRGRGTTGKREALRGSVGDASAIVTIQTFSGDITVSRR